MGNRILIIDDDISTANLLAESLADIGFQAEAVGAGVEALVKLRAMKYSIIIVDYHLPDTNGVVLATEALSINPSIQVIFLTGHRFDLQSLPWKKLNQPMVIEKPARLSEINEAVLLISKRGI